jgi:hypothetical protein
MAVIHNSPTLSCSKPPDNLIRTTLSRAMLRCCDAAMLRCCVGAWVRSRRSLADGGWLMALRLLGVACVVAPAWWWCTLARDEGSSGEKEVLLCRAM